MCPHYEVRKNKYKIYKRKKKRKEQKLMKLKIMK